MSGLTSYEGMRRRLEEVEAERGGMLNILAALVRQAGGRVVITDTELATDHGGIEAVRDGRGGLILRTSDGSAAFAGSNVGHPGGALDPRGDAESRRYL